MERKTRSTKAKTVDKKQTKKSEQEDQIMQRVLILPDKVLEVSGDTDDDSGPCFLTIRHPRTGDGHLFLFDSDKTSVCEVRKFERKHQSWLIDDSVQEEGGLYLCTPVDPLFLILPYIYQESKFTVLSQLLIDDEFFSISDVETCLSDKQLQNVADLQDCDDLRVVRFNKEKTLRWLRNKFDKLLEKLKEQNVRVAGGAQVSTFVRSTKQNLGTEDEYVRYAFGMLAEYLPQKIADDFKNELGIKDETKEIAVKYTNEKLKRKATGSPVKPTEDYSKYFADKPKPAKTPKLTGNLRALSKVNTKGMKSISSFFTKKA